MRHLSRVSLLFSSYLMVDGAIVSRVLPTVGRRRSYARDDIVVNSEIFKSVIFIVVCVFPIRGIKGEKRFHVEEGRCINMIKIGRQDVTYNSCREGMLAVCVIYLTK